jgi:hypothetical protein
VLRSWTTNWSTGVFACETADTLRGLKPGQGRPCSWA